MYAIKCISFLCFSYITRKYDRKTVKYIKSHAVLSEHAGE